jgi:hypothetical protein
MADRVQLDELRAVPLDQRLRSEDQWRIWIAHIRSAAINEDIWDYLNPDASEESVRQVPQATEEPTPSSIRDGAQEEWDLEEAEYKQFLIRIQAYERKETKRVRIQKVMGRINSLITRSLDPDFHYLVVDEDTPRKKLVKLAKEFKPKREIRTEDLRAAWRAMIKQPAKDVNIDKWLAQWKNLYEEGRCADVPDIVYNVKYAIRDFLRAIRPIDDLFTSTWEERILTKDVTFQEVVTAYGIRRGQQNSTQKKPINPAFATLDGQPEAKIEKTSADSKKPTCPCGRGGHPPEKCWYIVSSRRPPWWKPKEDTAKRVSEAIKRMNSEDQEAIQKLMKKQESAQFTSESVQDSQRMRMAMFTAKTAVSVNLPKGDYHMANSWILDSASTCHICNDRDRFINFTEEQGRLRTGDASTGYAGYGDVRVNLTGPDGVVFGVRLMNVRYSPGFQTNLMSLAMIQENGFDWNIQLGAIVRSEKLSKPVAKVTKMERLYVVEYNPPPASFAVKHSEKPLISSATAERWHRRLGHMYHQRIERLADMVDGIRIIGDSADNEKDNPERCQVCQLTNARRQISRRPQGLTFGKYGRIHWDLIKYPVGYNGDKWVTHFYIEGVRLHIAYTHEKKSGCQEAVENFCAFAKTQWNMPIQASRYDNERSAGRKVTDLLVSMGFIIEHSVVGTPEMNSFAERSGGVIITTARALLLDAGLPKTLWPEAVKAAIWIINRSPTKLPDGRWIVPYAEAMENGKIPKQRINLANLKVYGCRAYTRRQDIPNSDKMEPRASIGYLVGYVASNIWRVWYPASGAVREVRDAVFDENRFFEPKELERAPVSDVLEVMPWEIGQEDEEDVQRLTQRIDSINASETTSETPRDMQPSPSHQSKHAESAIAATQQVITPSPTPSSEPQSSRDAQPPPGAFPDDSHRARPAEQLQQELSSTATSYRAPRDIIGDISEENIVSGSRRKKPMDQSFYTAIIDPDEYHNGVLAAFATGLSSSRSHMSTHRDDLPPEPQTWKEMVNHPFNEGFMTACGLEIETIQRKETFVEEIRPNDRSIQILPLKWVFSYKLDSNGYLAKLKARICVRGDLQSVTADEKYSATLAARTARAVLALVAAFDLETYQYDAVNAFLNSFLDETVYTELPEGFRKDGKRCWRLLRALYGLRKSPRLWQREASKVLTSLGLQVVQEDICLFAGDGIIVFFYVDDIIVVNHPRQQERAKELRKRLNSYWELRDMGEAQWFLGIRILRDRQQKVLWLCQDSYISAIANRYHLAGTRSYETPLPPTSLSPYTGQATSAQIKEFQQKVGSTQYATTITRPDAAKATASLAQFLPNPGPEHLEAINRVISYLYHTRTLAIAYHTVHGEEEVVKIFSDASFGDHPDRKSSEGYICMIFGGPVDWKASKQRTVTTSTTEAELLAISEAGRTLSMWERLFKAIRFNPGHPIDVQCDNQQTIGVLTKEMPQLRTKLRHIDIHQHWLRQEVQAQRIGVRWVETEDMVADGLTKPLPRQKHLKFVNSLGMQDIQHHLD